MFLRPDNRPLSRRRGVTMVEVVMASAVFILLSLITVAGMIIHARMAKSNMSMQRMSEDARRLIDEMNVAALDATLIKLEAGPSGADTVVSFGRPDPDVPGGVLFSQYAFLDRDNKLATIYDNEIIMRTTDTPNATTGEVKLRYCSPIGGKIFTMDPKSGRPLVNITIRVGDRTFPANNADNAITGPGSQSFVINASVSRL